MFRVYKQQVIFNSSSFEEIWIDAHYEQKHSLSINDDLILSLLGEISKFLPLKVVQKVLLSILIWTLSTMREFIVSLLLFQKVKLI